VLSIGGRIPYDPSSGRVVVTQFEYSPKTALVMPAKAGIRSQGLDSGIRRNDVGIESESLPDGFTEGCSSLFIPWRHSSLTQSDVYFYYDNWGQIRKSGMGSQEERKRYNGMETYQKRIETIMGKYFRLLGKIIGRIAGRHVGQV